MIEGRVTGMTGKGRTLIPLDHLVKDVIGSVRGQAANSRFRSGSSGESAQAVELGPLKKTLQGAVAVQIQFFSYQRLGGARQISHFSQPVTCDLSRFVCGGIVKS